MFGLASLNPEFVELVAQYIQDPFFNDFTKEEYQQAVLRGDRKIAELYNLVNRVKQFESKITTPAGVNTKEYKEKALNTNIRLPIRSFKAEQRVIINEKEYTKATNFNLVKEDGKFLYYISYAFNGYELNYYPRTESDTITIFYASDIEAQDYSMDDYVALIPSKYDDERMKQAIISIAEQGILRYRDDKDPRRGKFVDALNLYRKDKDQINHRIAEREVVEMKPTRYPNG
jgi:hypothetical protein